MKNLYTLIVFLLIVLSFFYYLDLFFGIILLQIVLNIAIILGTGQGGSFSDKIDEIFLERSYHDSILSLVCFLIFSFLLFSTGDFTLTSLYVIVGLFSILNFQIRKRQLKWM